MHNIVLTGCGSKEVLPYVSFCDTPHRLSKYFRGQHHLEGIMLMENVPRSQLLTLIDKFSEVLVTCTLPEQLAA